MKVSELILELQKTLESGSDYPVCSYQWESADTDNIGYVTIDKRKGIVVISEYNYNEP